MTALASTAPPSPLPQRGIQGFFGAILAGLAAGGLCVLIFGSENHNAFLAGAILLMPIPLFLAGLGIGRGDAIVAAVVSAAVMTIGLNAKIMMVMLAVYVLPVLLLCLLALRYRYDDHGDLFWYPAGRLLTALTLYPIIVFGLFSMMSGNVDLEGLLRDMMTGMLDTALKLETTPTVLNDPEIKKDVVAMIVSILPGMFTASWILVILTNALWAQYALANNKAALRPMPKLTEMELPSWLLVLLALMGLLASFFDGPVAYFAQNTLLPLSLPYFFVGMALMHVWAERRKHKMLWLIAFYVLVGISGWPAVLVTAAGVLEPWLHLRAKITAARKRPG